MLIYYFNNMEHYDLYHNITNIEHYDIKWACSV
jgi:hypothetical protein